MLNARMSSISDSSTLATDTNFWVHLQFQMGATEAPTFARTLSTFLANHTTSHDVTAPVAFTGASTVGPEIVLTFSVGLGPVDQIASFSPAAAAGYDTLRDLIEHFEGFYPAYAPEPTDAEVSAADHLRTPLGLDGAVRAAA